MTLPAASASAIPTSNTSDPFIKGSEPRQEGQTLTVDPGEWDAPPGTVPDFSYKWYRGCSPSGSGCVAIPGAQSQSYQLVPADVGKRIKAVVTAGCKNETTDQSVPPPACEPSSEGTDPTGPVLPDPHNAALPEISGTAQEGQRLSASVGFWRTLSGLSLSYGYQWLRCDGTGQACSGVAGATGTEYSLGTADVGSTLRVSVTARNRRPRQGTATSAPTDPVAALPRRRPRPTRLLSPFPKLVLAGSLAPGGVVLSEFSVRAPRGSLVKIRCRGRGCPYRSKRARVRSGSRRMRVRSLERRLRAGVVVVVTVTKRGLIGKYTRIRIRRGRVPARVDRCLRPGARRPSRCPGGR